MARFQRLALSAASCMVLLAAQQATAAPPATNYVDGQCVTTYDATVDYFPEKLNTSKYPK